MKVRANGLTVDLKCTFNLPLFSTVPLYLSSKSEQYNCVRVRLRDACLRSGIAPKSGLLNSENMRTWREQWLELKEEPQHEQYFK